MENLVWIIPLAIIAIAANATMDEIRFHWSRNFEHWVGGTKIKLWLDPASSWQNKYRWTENKYLQWMFSSPLVFITDFWHFLKFIMLNCLYGIIILLSKEIGLSIHWAWMLLGCNIGWGFVYEFVSGMYGLLSDKKNNNSAT